MIRAAHPDSTIPLIFCFDVEPDGFFIDPSRREPWPGFEATFAFVEKMRPRWEALTGRPARVNWFLRLDPQIAQTYGDAAWVLHHYERQFAILQAHGDELGIHPHGYRWAAEQQAWLLDYENQSWIEHCIQSSLETFTRELGRPCRAFRGGDRWMNQATASFVRRLGMRFDLTLEPGHPAEALNHPDERVTGSLPDMRHAPNRPYQPHPDNYLLANDSVDVDGQREMSRDDVDDGDGKSERFWAIPVTTARIEPGLLRRIYYRVRYPGRQIDTWTALLSHHPEMFERIVAAVLARPRPYLAMPMRTNALAHPRHAPRVAANLETLLRLLRSRSAAVVTPDEALSLLAPPLSLSASR